MLVCVVTDRLEMEVDRLVCAAVKLRPTCVLRVEKVLRTAELVNVKSVESVVFA